MIQKTFVQDGPFGRPFAFLYFGVLKAWISESILATGCHSGHFQHQIAGSQADARSSFFPLPSGPISMNFDSGFSLNRRHSLLKLAVTCSLAISLSVGCGAKAPPKPKTEQASIGGTVKNGDKTVPVNTEVVFENSKEGLTIAAKTDSSGKFQLSATDPRIGIPVGRYKVAVRPPTAVVAPVQPGSADYQKLMQSGGQAAPPPVAGSELIPDKFHKHDSSGLEFEAKVGQNDFAIDLSK